MIDPKDLMIGNYLHDNKGNLCRVEKIEKDSFYAPVIEGALTHLPNHPVELTPAILERCGFVKEFDNRQSAWIFMQNIEGSNIIVQHYKDGEYIFIWELNSIGKLIYSLHQLQNLANVLGVKLNLTPPK